MEDDYESVLLVIKECMVYRIPPRATSRGYRASDWDVNQFLWEGRLRIIAKGDDLFINLEDKTTGELFAQCPYNMDDGTSVEPVLDSSRYFVLTIVDKTSGKHAFIGIGFPERSFAFDFNVAIQDHVKIVNNKKAGLTPPKQRVPAAPKIDFSLKSDQKITISLGKVGGTKKKPFPDSSSIENMFLPPPPPPSQSSRLPTMTNSASSSFTESVTDPFTIPSQEPHFLHEKNNNSNNGKGDGDGGDGDGWANFGDFVQASNDSMEQGQGGWATFD